MSRTQTQIGTEECVGCEDDVYNHGLGGAKACWSLASAKLIIRYAIGTWTETTRHHAYEEVIKPSCFKRKGIHYHDKLPDFVRVEDVLRRARKEGA